MAIIPKAAVDARRAEAFLEAQDRAAVERLQPRIAALEAEARQRGFESGVAEGRALFTAGLADMVREIEAATQRVAGELRASVIVALEQIVGVMPAEEQIERAVTHALAQMGVSGSSVLHVNPAVHGGLRIRLDAAGAYTLQLADDALLEPHEAVLETAFGRVHIGPRQQIAMLAEIPEKQT